MIDSIWLELDQEWNSMHFHEGKPGDVFSLMIDGKPCMFRVLEAKGKKIRVTKMETDND